MDRSSILVPLLVFIGINAGVDAVVGIAVLASETHSPETVWNFLFVGLLWGQFGLCCGSRLRFAATRHYAYLGMFLIPVAAIVILLPTIFIQSNQEFIALVMLTVGFTVLFCVGPHSLVQWLSSQGLENRFTLQQMFIGTILIAFACVIVMNVQVAVGMALGVFVLALPSIIASNLLAKAVEITGYSWMMASGMFICILFTMIQPMAAPLLGMFMAQIMVLWMGGILLISIGQGSAQREVAGLPEE
ncbi:hypothetical protein Pan97_00190 [Bremerella volcania]|uniref:Uncharacterized protein n=1 Tax=Bremerella volcania TaxID=2527984 RepID=A0A518C1E4_9BACT|nr:hypothetical protein [Bremerella volcania]QDU73052.1 hypothetical protein Pan97_00190 [Bremerella volcania]